jgi:hypothetical protein
VSPSICSIFFRCFINLSHTHYLVHIHGNNYSEVINGIPNVVELTYINKNCFDEEPELNKTTLPIYNLDFPNNPNSSDYDLNFSPFVN